MVANGLLSNFNKWFPIVADVLLHPSFPATELEDAKHKELSGLQGSTEQSEFSSRQILPQDTLWRYS
jgi:predicted Zn-dependent peptidase